MAKITFTRDADYRHNNLVTTAYKAGWTGTVKREIQLWAIEKGHGFEPDTEPNAESGELANGDILPDDSAAIFIQDSSTGGE